MPEAVLIVFSFLIGAVVGSFLNVCVHRLPRGMLLHRPPSHCPFCNEAVRWYDNVPVASYLALGRRCRCCGIRISPRYAVLELVTGAMFAYITWRLTRGMDVDYVRLGVYVAVATALAAASFVDIECRIIPDEISPPGTLLAPVVALVWPHLLLSQGRDHLIVGPLAGLLGATPASHPHLCSLMTSVAGIAAGFVVVWALGVMGRLIFRKEAMGFGDVKLMAFVGGFVGWRLVLMTIMVGACFGAVVGLVSMARSRDTRMPFGPYLSLGALVAMLHAGDVVRLFERYAAAVAGAH
ncbi:MAG: prepilin peptidase [Candidatus Brocadiae bacterium]|nr:prepilin peptidase [Candidatus Brocadiia bacterium]